MTISNQDVRNIIAGYGLMALGVSGFDETEKAKISSAIMCTVRETVDEARAEEIRQELIKGGVIKE
jgi:hypothetical protein